MGYLSTHPLAAAMNKWVERVSNTSQPIAQRHSDPNPTYTLNKIICREIKQQFVLSFYIENIYILFCVMLFLVQFFNAWPNFSEVL